MSLNQLILRLREYPWHRFEYDARDMEAEFIGDDGKPARLVVLTLSKQGETSKVSAKVALSREQVLLLAAGFDKPTPANWQEEKAIKKALLRDHPDVREYSK